MSVFLSASIPIPERNAAFFATADVFGIRDSVKSLAIEVARREEELVFGGHPAITPLIALVLKRVYPNAAGRFVLFQSEYFVRQFPAEVDDFVNLIVVPSVQDDRELSLQAMRQAMLSHADFRCGVFIGGMEGIVEEFELFKELHPDAPAYPIASTGGAAQMVFEERGGDASLKDKLTYPTLFRNLLR